MTMFTMRMTVLVVFVALMAFSAVVQGHNKGSLKKKYVQHGKVKLLKYGLNKKKVNTYLPKTFLKYDKKLLSKKMPVYGLYQSKKPVYMPVKSSVYGMKRNRYISYPSKAFKKYNPKGYMPRRIVKLGGLGKKYGLAKIWKKYKKQKKQKVINALKHYPKGKGMRPLKTRGISQVGNIGLGRVNVGRPPISFGQSVFGLGQTQTGINMESGVGIGRFDAGLFGSGGGNIQGNVNNVFGGADLNMRGDLNSIHGPVGTVGFQERREPLWDTGETLPGGRVTLEAA